MCVHAVPTKAQKQVSEVPEQGLGSWEASALGARNQARSPPGALCAPKHGNTSLLLMAPSVAGRVGIVRAEV